MTAGKIRFAEGDGTFILKFIGDVRLTLCTTLDGFIDEMFRNESVADIIIDLTETEGIDSTSLGLLARLSRQAGQQYRLTPTIWSTNQDITRILETMGFRQVFNIVEEAGECQYQYADLPFRECTEQSAREKVEDAHTWLCNLNDKNREMFGPLLREMKKDKAG
ncbi:STAS domain-containing protein [Endozoicomonadaceae bacterium StTr2]